jgi:hypothetical protein
MAAAHAQPGGRIIAGLVLGEFFRLSRGGQLRGKAACHRGGADRGALKEIAARDRPVHAQLLVAILAHCRPLLLAAISNHQADKASICDVSIETYCDEIQKINIMHCSEKRNAGQIYDHTVR